jgi:hypothetical protein
MPKKNMTPEERKAWGEKMKAARAAKRNQKANQTRDLPQEPSGAPTPVQEPRDPGNPKEQSVDELQKHILEVLSNLFGGVPQTQQQAQLTDRGVVGTKERYPVDPSGYPDPRERLSSEPRLKPVGFEYNYELEYLCNPTKRYQTQDGVWFVEPQFTLTLNRVVLDDMGQPTTGRYTICRGIFFEDPETAIQMAMDMGIPVQEDEKLLLDEMRYLRMRDWLFDAFYTPIDTSPKRNKKTMVVDGREVEYFEVSGENSQTIPFAELDSRRKLRV